MPPPRRLLLSKIGRGEALTSPGEDQCQPTYSFRIMPIIYCTIAVLFPHLIVRNRRLPAPFIPNREYGNSIQACGGSSVVKKSPGDLREQAKRLRRLASGIDDHRTLEAIAELAAEYEAVAAAVER